MAWNRNSEPIKSVKKDAPPSMLKGIAGVLAAVAVCALAIWMFSGGDEKPKVKAVKKSAQIKEVKPAPAATNVAPEALGKGFRRTRTGAIIKVPKNPFGTPIPKDLEYKPFWEYTPEDCARVDPGYAARHELFLEREKNSVFKTGSDRMLSVMLFSEPGQPNLLIPFDESFVKQFYDSLKTPIVVTHDDSPEVQEQKRAMIEARQLIKDKIDAGEDVVKFLNDEMKQMKKIQGLRDSLMEELLEVRKNSTSVDEIKDYVKAANVMLEEAGGAKVGFSDKLLERSVQWNKLRLEEASQK